MGYIERVKLAAKKHPEFFSSGANDCCIQHDKTCNMVSGGFVCNCVPDITITSKSGKFNIDTNGDCRRLGAEGELIPTLIDPRRADLN